MSNALIITLIVFSITWIFVILKCIRDNKLSIKYSLVWLFMAIVVLFVGIFTNFMEIISEFFGFIALSNLVIGIILTLLMIITLYLTIIVTKQKEQIKNLIQEVSIIKKNINNK